MNDEEARDDPPVAEPEPTDEPDEAPSPGDADPDSEAPAEDGEPQSEAGDRPKLFRELTPRERLGRAALIAFTIYHLSALLLGGTVYQFRKHFNPVIGFYADGLRMTNNWGMFGKPPSNTNVLIEAEKKDGTRTVLATTLAPGRTLFERVRDVRVRKIQAKLTDEGDRGRFGQYYLDYYCRRGKALFGDDLRAMRATELVHELKNDEGVVTRAPTTRSLIVRRCTERLGPITPPKAQLPSILRVPRKPEGAAPPSGEDT